MDMTSPMPPPKICFVMAVAKPRICPAEMDGGMDSAFGSVTTSMSAGPLRSRPSLRARRRSLGRSTRTDGMPTARPMFR